MTMTMITMAAAGTACGGDGHDDADETEPAGSALDDDAADDADVDDVDDVAVDKFRHKMRRQRASRDVLLAFCKQTPHHFAGNAKIRSKTRYLRELSSG